MARVLEVDGITRRFGDRVVLDDVSFAVEAGETYGLLGPNGAGKTTAISIVCGILRADAGEVRISGAPLDRAHRSAIGLVPQDLALYPDLSARENLVYFGRLQGLGGDRLTRRIDEVLELTGLSERGDDRVDEFSGGMKRRANIGVGLLHEPKLLILDEPTVGVDPQSRNAILESVGTLEGLSVLYTTHYMEEAERLCNRIGIIDEGRLVAEGTRRELLDQVHEPARIRLQAEGALSALCERARLLDGVAEARSADRTVEVVVADANRVLAPLVEAAEQVGVQVSAIDVDEPDLETVFLHLTGKALRD